MNDTITVMPTDALARFSLEALTELRAAVAERSRLTAEFEAHLSPTAKALFREVSDAYSESEGAEIRLHVSELARHFPGLAPAIRLAWAHVIDCRLDSVATCCTDGAPIEP
jgi:hypothetical protein